MSKPLRVGINELVVAYAKSQLDAGELVDIAQMTHEIAQSLVDVIMQQEDDQGFLFAYALASRRRVYATARPLIRPAPIEPIGRQYIRGAQIKPYRNDDPTTS